MNKTLVALLFMSPINAWAICENAQSTVEINECLIKEIDKADKELNETYQSILKKMSEADRALLKKAQKAWVVNYEADLAFVSQHWSEGTYAGIRYGHTKYDLLKSRIAELKDFVKI